MPSTKGDITSLLGMKTTTELGRQKCRRIYRQVEVLVTIKQGIYIRGLGVGRRQCEIVILRSASAFSSFRVLARIIREKSIIHIFIYIYIYIMYIYIYSQS